MGLPRRTIGLGMDLPFAEGQPPVPWGAATRQHGPPLLRLGRISNDQNLNDVFAGEALE